MTFSGGKEPLKVLFASILYTRAVKIYEASVPTKTGFNRVSQRHKHPDESSVNSDLFEKIRTFWPTLYRNNLTIISKI